MKIKHYAFFNNLNKHLDWEALRNDNTEKSYFLPFTKDEYLSVVDTRPISETAEIIIKELHENGYKKIFSIGSGIGFIEYQVKQNSEIFVTVSDYNTSILRLKKFDIFDGAIIMDAFLDTFPFDESYVILFPRIDTEFDDKQLSFLFEKCYLKGVRYICFLPANLLNFKMALAELKVWVYSVMKRKNRVFCGYCRSKSAFIKLWNPYYMIAKEFKTNKEFYFLKVNKPPMVSP
jgi:hypothetical protein